MRNRPHIVGNPRLARVNQHGQMPFVTGDLRGIQDQARHALKIRRACFVLIPQIIGYKPQTLPAL
jgi:hypothetical protein